MDLDALTTLFRSLVPPEFKVEVHCHDTDDSVCFNIQDPRLAAADPAVHGFSLFASEANEEAVEFYTQILTRRLTSTFN